MSPLKTLVATITEPQIFNALIRKSFTPSFKYFLFWQLIMALVATTIISFTTYPRVYQQFQSALSDVKNNYPDNLVLIIENHQLIVEGVEPPVAVKNLIIIDPPAVAESLSQKDALILLTAPAAALKLPGVSEPRVVTYKDLDLSGSLTKSELVKMIDDQAEFLLKVKYFIPVLILISQFLVLSLGRFIFLALNIILIVAVGWIIGRNYGYNAYLKLGLHTIIPSEIIFLLTGYLYGQQFPAIFSIAFFGITLFAAWSLSPTKLRG